MAKKSWRVWSIILRLFLGSFCVAGKARTGDWPQWRDDAGRTAETPESLGSELYLHSTWQYPAVKAGERRFAAAERLREARDAGMKVSHVHVSWEDSQTAWSPCHVERRVYDDANPHRFAGNQIGMALGIREQLLRMMRAP